MKNNWQKEFDKKFCFDLLGVKTLFTNRDQTIDMKDFIQSLLDDMARDIDAVKIITPTVELPKNSLTQNQIFASGQINMKMRIYDVFTKWGVDIKI